ncbi:MULTISPECIES: autorepressor SdpR family transcription factor [Peptoniphilus]|uniref:autorepressor SdpR family transcription factor n=1 Tax=Peptoniphilus TaxID=162289 RepID=UPI0001DA9AC6|nr:MULTISPECIES: autorepressor SdpR family transcription factor [Peptoniphilus]EFI42016.1 putative arsenical resistance operon repressor [Peptoniphilus sp. oral taxon 386 str. F0131]
MSLEKTFKALSDNNRREILEMLKNGMMSAGDIAENFDMTQATVSYHLSILKDAGLILEYRDGNFRNYVLNTSVFEELMSYVFSMVNEKGET